MTTWRDVERVHRANPKWSFEEIARELGCGSAYVRATAARRKLPILRVRDSKRFARVLVPLRDLGGLCLQNETPHAALERIVTRALSLARAA